MNNDVLKMQYSTLNENIVETIFLKSKQFFASVCTQRKNRSNLVAVLYFAFSVYLSTMQCNAMQCNAMRCNAMQCNAKINNNAMQCNAMQCNAMQCNAMQCYAMQCQRQNTISCVRSYCCFLLYLRISAEANMLSVDALT